MHSDKFNFAFLNLGNVLSMLPVLRIFKVYEMKYNIICQINYGLLKSWGLIRMSYKLFRSAGFSPAHFKLFAGSVSSAANGTGTSCRCQTVVTCCRVSLSVWQL